MPAVSITGKKTLGDLVKNRCLRPAAAALVKPLWRWVPRSAYLGKSPMHLGLAITRKCNANCVFCPYQFAHSEDKVHMSDAMFDLALERIREAQVAQVMLSPNLGEPISPLPLPSMPEAVPRLFWLVLRVRLEPFHMPLKVA